jgi:hypothetical protein
MTEAQEFAALAVMRGTFKHRDVRQALMRANVPLEDLDTATNSIIQRERQAGRIRLEKIDGEPVTTDDQWIKVSV